MTFSSHSKHKHGRTSLPKPDLKLYVKDVDDPHGRKRQLTVKTWATVKDVKDTIQKHFHVPPSSQRLYFGPLLTAGSALPNYRSLEDAGIYRNNETLYLEIKGHGHDEATSSSTSAFGRQHVANSIATLKSQGVNDVCISKSMLDLTHKPLRRIIQQARRGMALGLKPDLVLDGSGGTYYLHDARKVRVAVFKPADEEPYAENNPRGYVRQGQRINKPHDHDHNNNFDYSTSNNAQSDSMSMRAGIEPGEACLREVAAYLLDHDSFTGVPMTTLAEARHPAFHNNGSMLKLTQGGASVGNHSLQLGTSSSLQPQQSAKKVGSCQEFVHAECSMDDLGPTKISVDQVHKIAILDIRIMNADRNTANLLCRRNPEDPDFFELVPIDHGYCLRTVADVCWFDWCWLDWPQMKQPLSTQNKVYILQLDVEGEAKMLKERLNIPDKALDYFKASSKLLQAGVRSGMTLYDIAVLCCRNDDCGELPSKLETIMTMAGDISKSAVDNRRWHRVAALKALEQQLSPEHISSRLTRNTLEQGCGNAAVGSLNMFKSKSSMNFSSFTTSLDLISSNSINPPTPMAQSSGSDSSNDSVDQEASVGEDECEEWAAAFIADKLEPIKRPKPVTASRRQRSISFARSASQLEESELSIGSLHSSSSGSSGSSPPGGGFWFVPPSASKQEVEDDNSSSSPWSPYTSPALSPISPELGLGRSLDQENLDLKAQRLVKFDMSTLIPPRTVRTSISDPEDKVTNSANDDISNDANNDSHGNNNSNPPSTLALEPPMELYGIRRSQSYSAFSSFSRISPSEDAAESSRYTKQTRESTEQLRHYFHKFVDLLIDREITPIIRSRQASISTDNTNDGNFTKNKNVVDMNLVKDQLEQQSVFV